MADLELDKLQLPVAGAEPAPLPAPLPASNPDDPNNLAGVNNMLQEQALTSGVNVPANDALRQALSTIPPNTATPASTPQSSEAATTGVNYGVQNSTDPAVLFPMQRNTTSKDTVNKNAGANYNPDDEVNLGKAQLESITANNAAFDAQKTLNEKLFETSQDSAKNYNDIAAKQQAAEDVRQKTVADKFQALSDLTNNLNNNSTIDPNRIFANMGTGAKILAGIGLALGALGQAKSAPGSGNMAMDVINNAIDRDVQAQKDTFNNQVKSVEAQRQGFGQYMAVLGDQRSAELAEKNRQLDYAKQQIDLIQNNPKYQNDIMEAQTDKLNAAINEKIATTNLELHKKTYENTTNNKTAVMDTTENAKYQRSVYIDPATGFTGQAPDETTANNFRARAAEVQNTNAALGRLRDAMKDHTYAQIQLDPELKAQTEKDVALLNDTLVASAIGAKRITGQTIQATTKSMGNPLEVFTRGSVVKAKLDALVKDQNADLAREAAIAGLKPVKGGVKFTPYNYSK